MQFREASYTQEELLEAVSAAPSFGEALKIVRFNSKNGQRELAEVANVAQGIVVRWESNKIVPTHAQFEKICSRMRVKTPVREVLNAKLSQQESTLSSLKALRVREKPRAL